MRQLRATRRRPTRAIAVSYGYSRDHRADLKQWMLALATTLQGDVPLFCQALGGNASDKVSLLAAVEALAEQLRPAEEGADGVEVEVPIFVADSGLYSAQNVAQLGEAGAQWISRAPDTSTEAHAALDEADDAWQQDAQEAQDPERTRWWAPVVGAGGATARGRALAGGVHGAGRRAGARDARPQG